MDLPTFRYHPDPISTESVKPSNDVCDCCGKQNGFVYTPSFYSVHTPEAICPWCIADGSAHEKYDGEFTDSMSIGGDGIEWETKIVDEQTHAEIVKREWDEVPQNVVEEIAHCTPGFSGYQQEKWWTHCKDGGAFLGFAGDLDPSVFGEDAAVEFVSRIKEEFEFTAEEWQRYIHTPDSEHGMTTYVFRCLHCGVLGGYGDFC